jgi:protocatechuate 3,4-dioxygenase, alpha subunit
MRTPSQTVGPFFSFGLCTTPQHELPGGTVRVEGQVFDGEETPVADALLELWDPAAGWGRCGTDADGRFAFLVPEGVRRLEVTVFARGMLRAGLTRLYLAPDGAEDETMVARRQGDGYRYDVHLQGERATALFQH